MAQFLRPDSDIANTWTNGFAAIDEATASDSDFTYSANNPNGSGAEFGLSNPSVTPGSGTVTIRYRYAQVNNGVLSGTGTATSLVVELLEGATVRGTSATHSPNGAFQAGSFTVDASTITNWNDLRVKFAASGGSGNPSNRRGVAVSWAEVEAPDGNPAGNAAQGSLFTVAVSQFAATAFVPGAPGTPFLQNNAEGGTDGVAVTTANSGGSSGDAWNGVDTGTGGIVAFEASPARDTLSYLIDSTAGTRARLQWDFTNSTNFYGRIDAYLPTGTAAIELRLVELYNGTRQRWVGLTSDRKITVDGTTVGAVTVPLDQWVRIEFHADAAGTSIAVRLYLLADGTVHDEEISTTIAATGTAQVFFGDRAAGGYGPLYLDNIALGTGGWLGPASGGGEGSANASLQSLTASVLASSPSGSSTTTASLQAAVASLLSATAGGKGTGSAALQSIGSSLMAHAATGKAGATAALVGAASASFAVEATGQGQTTVALVNVPVSLLGGTATGSAGAQVPLLVTVSSVLNPQAVGKALATSGLQTVGISAFAATASVGIRALAALQSMTGSVLTVDPTGAAEAAAVLQSVGMTLFSANAGGTATHDAALLLVSGAVLAAEAHGRGSVGPDLLTASVAVLTALAAGAAVAQAAQVSASLSLFNHSANAGSSSTANANLMSLNVSTLDATASAGAEVVAALLAAAWSINATSTGGGQSATASAGLLAMALSQMATQPTGSAIVIPGLVGSEFSALAAQVTAGANVSAGLQSADWAAFSASAGGAQSALATAALLVIGLTLQSAGATGAAIGVAGVAGLVAETLDAVAMGAGLADAGITSVSVSVLEAWAGETIANFEGAATAATSLTGRGSVALSLVGVESNEVAA